MLVNSSLIRDEGYFRPGARRPGPSVGAVPPGRRPRPVGRLPGLAAVLPRAAGPRLPDRNPRSHRQVTHPGGGRNPVDLRRDDLPPARIHRLALDAERVREAAAPARVGRLPAELPLGLLIGGSAHAAAASTGTHSRIEAGSSSMML